jgi:hypothetical protein
MLARLDERLLGGVQVVLGLVVAACAVTPFFRRSAWRSNAFCLKPRLSSAVCSSAFACS